MFDNDTASRIQKFFTGADVVRKADTARAYSFGQLCDTAIKRLATDLRKADPKLTESDAMISVIRNGHGAALFNLSRSPYADLRAGDAVRAIDKALPAYWANTLNTLGIF